MLPTDFAKPYCTLLSGNVVQRLPGGSRPPDERPRLLAGDFKPAGEPLKMNAGRFSGAPGGNAAEENMGAPLHL